MPPWSSLRYYHHHHRFHQFPLCACLLWVAAVQNKESLARKSTLVKQPRRAKIGKGILPLVAEFGFLVMVADADALMS